MEEMADVAILAQVAHWPKVLLQRNCKLCSIATQHTKMAMSAISSMLLLALVSPSAGLTTRGVGIGNPMGTLPAVEGDTMWASKADACQACRYYATGSCAMYKTCTCSVTNTTDFPVSGLKAPSDVNSWLFACGTEGGKKYQDCWTYKDSEEERMKYAKMRGKTYNDNFGDAVDPNAPKCPS